MISTGEEFAIRREWSPFKGANHYTGGDQAWFFCRQREISNLLRLADQYPVTILSGVSASGKTSLLEAGFAPEAERNRRVVLLDMEVNVATRLREKANRYLAEEQSVLLPEGDPAQIISRLPAGWMVILDRVEQAFFCGERVVDEWSEQGE